MSSPDREAQEWPPPWARTVAFTVGMGLIVWETVIDQAQHLIVYGPAFALTGLPLARGVELLLSKIPGVEGITGRKPPRGEK